ncbi:MAG TPA: tetratricopeptide repeat protein [Myxococcales bacterium]|nr:tetratricopeptide repeat protein [Myxococcales bacterium]
MTAISQERVEILAGPTRKLSMSQEKNDFEKELGEIRKEVIESRNLVIKTDNLLKNLHAEMKMVGKQQVDFQKRQWISSAAAYVAFAVIAVGGGLMIASARTAGAGADRDRLEKQVTDLTQQVDKQRADAQALASAQKSAADVYKMMTTLPGDDRLKGVDLLLKLDTSKLSFLERQALNDKAEQLRREIGQAAFERGKAAFRRNEWPAVITDLGRFVAMNPAQQDLVEASLFLGVAYNQTRKHEQAVPLLARFVAEDRKSKVRDYAMLLLAQSYQETSQLDKAAQTARDALGQYPNSEFAGGLKSRLSSVKRAQGGNPDPADPAGVTVGTAAPTPGAPAPAAPAPAAAKPPAPAPAPAAAKAPAPAPAPAAKPPAPGAPKPN